MMKSKFILGVLAGVICSMLVFGVFFTSYVYGAAKADDSTNASEDIADNGSDVLADGTTDGTTSEDSSTQGVDLDAAKDEIFEKMNYINDLIDTYSLYGVSKEALEDGIYKGMMWSLDDKYATYYTKEEFTAMNESSSGVYCGIGALVSQDVNTGIISIVKPFTDGPAYNIGILPGDVIYKVDELEVTGMDLSKVVTYMKGEAGTQVVITIYREGVEEAIEYTITRDWIEVETVESEMMANNTGYIMVSEFDEVTVEQFINAVDDLENQGMTSLIIDLRNNPGGLVDSAVAMLDRLLPPGLLVYTEDKDGVREEENAIDDTKIDVPIVVLMNKDSASASEIFAGALQDYGVAKVLGVQSYGKGIVQVIVGLYDDSGIKLTISEYFTPLGNKVHGIGITPDIEVELGEGLNQLVTIPKEDDNQIQEAIKYLQENQK